MVASKARLLLGFIVAAACGGKQQAPAGPAPGDDPTLGNQVAMVMPSVDGGEIDLTRFRGRPLVLHVATTASLDAQADVEELRRTRDQRPDIALLEIVFDEGGSPLAMPWANASGIDWAVALPTAQVRSGQSPLGAIEVIPTTFVADRQGVLVWRWQGALPRGKLVAEIDATLGR
jgi:hypothetical protein